MTAYELWKKAYMHYEGRTIRRICVGANHPKEYILQSFNEGA